MAVRFGIDFADFEQLQKKIEQIPQQSENALNQVIHREGATLIQENILQRLPISKVNGRNRRKKHAKTSQPFQVVTSNLSVEIKPKARFRYLVFPNKGLGNKNKNPQEFMEVGVADATPKIVEKLNQAMDRIINE
ncbi:Gp9 protein [Listeria grandensis FSL F6-0971]|uniref:Gp9 protein n=1 Tax=Listeria grandensis FSL F6-0971 TaxID=1265819 RepID=W7BAH7_9LIST|nr:hypothetical protein [Listeria grandensis]EUJ22987.1 Gp9 protein [Listeria grandensis FSL F6-0971]